MPTKLKARQGNAGLEERHGGRHAKDPWIQLSRVKESYTMYGRPPPASLNLVSEHRKVFQLPTLVQTSVKLLK